MNYTFAFKEYEPDKPVHFAVATFAGREYNLAFENGIITEIITGENDTFINKEDAKDFFVSENNKMVNLGNFFNQLESDYEELEAQEVQNHFEEQLYRAALESPYLTGRI